MFEEEVYLTSLIHLVVALIAGGLIGLERSYQGRPAGFRTHALVCMASSLLMLLTIYQVRLMKGIPLDAMRIDPTRMAQGIMTGIGFLGAGVIMKDHFTIRGLTTAASIWITAAIGILIGIGFYVAAAFSTALTLGALSLFRWLEAIMPTQHYARLELRTRAANRASLEELLALIAKFDCSAANPGYGLERDGSIFRYEVTLRSLNRDNFYRLSEALTALDKTVEFHIHPSSE